MIYRRERNQLYIRVDKGEEVLGKILEVCERESVKGGSFMGIGACKEAVTATYVPEENDFKNHSAEGMLEMVSLMGNVCLENRKLIEHSHASFSYFDESDKLCMLAGHLKKAIVSYTAEIVLTISEKPIEKVFDDKVGITVWNLN